MNGLSGASEKYDAGCGSATDKPVSPCASTYQDLAHAQERLSASLINLRSRLGDALRDPFPKAESPLTAVKNPSQSELHGMFIAALDRAETQIAQVDDIIERLTV